MKSLKMYLCMHIMVFLGTINAGGGDPQNMLQAAILNDSKEGVEKAVRIGADINENIGSQSSNKQTPLLMAYSIKHQNAVQALLGAGAKPDENLLKKAFVQNDFDSALVFIKQVPSLSNQWLEY